MSFTTIKTTSIVDNEYVKVPIIKYNKHDEHDDYTSTRDAYFIAYYDETIAKDEYDMAKTAYDMAKTAYDMAKTACNMASDILERCDAYNASKTIYDSAFIAYVNAQAVTSRTLVNFTIAQNAYDAYIDDCIDAINYIRIPMISS